MIPKICYKQRKWLMENWPWMLDHPISPADEYYLFIKYTQE
jgi:hypothetical protein